MAAFRTTAQFVFQYFLAGLTKVYVLKSAQLVSLYLSNIDIVISLIPVDTFDHVLEKYFVLVELEKVLELGSHIKTVQFIREEKLL